jgi:hypothetical protein
VGSSLLPHPALNPTLGASGQALPLEKKGHLSSMCVCLRCWRLPWEWNTLRAFPRVRAVAPSDVHGDPGRWHSCPHFTDGGSDGGLDIQGHTVGWDVSFCAVGTCSSGASK